VDLPTYTNIWRIEKRLYKLYDFRLPMPLPINWIAVFAGITIPYIVLLIAIGLPFNHTLVWLYVLPPGVLTWLTTRPVIENKRLPELVESQVRYLTEPRTWVRLTPLSEKDQVVLTARVWHGRRVAKRPAPARRHAPVARPALPSAEPERQLSPLRPGPVLKPTSVFRPEPGQGIAQGQAARQRDGGAAPQRPRIQERSRAQERSGGQERVRVQERSRAQGRPGTPARGQGTMWRPPALPPVRPAPATPASPPAAPVMPVVPVAAPEPSGLPAHAIPDVPPAAAIAPPFAPAPTFRPAPESRPEPEPRPAPQVRPESEPRPAPGPAARPADPPTPVIAPVSPAKPAAGPTRVRANGSGGARLEVSHDGPRRRQGAGKASSAQPVEPVQPVQSAQPSWPVRPAPEPPSVEEPPARSAPQGLASPTAPPVPPADPAHVWPVPARPLRPVPSGPDERDAAGVEEGTAPAALVTPAPAAPVAPAPETPVTETQAPEAPLPEVSVPEVSVPQAPLLEASVPAADTLEAPTPVAVPQAAAPVEAPAEVVEPPVPAASAAAASRVEAEFPVEAVPPVEEVLAPPTPAVQQVTSAKRPALPSIERALSGPARDLNASWGGKVKVVTGNGATHGPGARDQEAQDRNRARLPISEPRRILILGCTSGAGQSVTTLMTASMLASLREHPVAAVDLHDGTLARYRAPAAWLEELLAGRPPQHIRPTRPDGLHPTPKPSPARLDVVAAHEPLNEGDEIKLAVQFGRHYPLTLLDPGAAALTRLLKVTDQLVVVVPANVDAAGALADTRDWLDNNGHADLAMQSVTVINGVSRRSLPDVESAESIARGRSRAIVRIPWDDMLPVAAANPSTLRAQTRVAYTALAGVLVAGLAAVPVRKRTP